MFDESSELSSPEVALWRGAQIQQDAVPSGAKFEWILLTDLRRDPRSERAIQDYKVRRFVDNFDPDAIGVIYVNRRANGSLVVFDGQHRCAAMKLMGWDDQRVPSLVYDGLSVEDEARLFVILNRERSKPRPHEVYEKSVTAGDVTACGVESVLRKRGLKVGAGPKTGGIQAAGALLDIVRKYGVKRLDDVIATVQGAWGVDSTSFQTTMLRAVTIVFTTFRKLDRARLVATLARHEPRALMAKASSRQREDLELGLRRHVDEVLARNIVALYNRGLRANRLEWPDA